MDLTDLDTQIFASQVEHWILEAIASGVATFDQLLLTLPSVYPSIVFQAIQKLATERKISPQIAENILHLRDRPKPLFLPHPKISLPVPHPLDYDWRFCDATVEDLLNRCQSFTSSDDTIALIGTPSLLRIGIETSFSRKLILFEVNQRTIDRFAGIVPRTQLFCCDILHQPLPNLAAKAVVLDPPWYPEYIQSFLWSACQLCCFGGYILISLPTFGTRPGIEREWLEIQDWAKKLGLTLCRLEEVALSYITPTFELNVLKIEGFENIAREWRRGNLAIFQRTHQNDIPRPIVQTFEEEWIGEVLDGVEIRVKKPTLLEFSDPSLNSIVPGDVLPSVSRRDSRRHLADVWTSGNRIFACQGRKELLLILRALAEKRSPHQAIAKEFNRPLNYYETQQVSQTIHQIIELVRLEQKENQTIGEQENYKKLSQFAS